MGDDWMDVIGELERIPDHIEDEVTDSVDDSLGNMEQTSKAYLRSNDTNYRGETRRSHRIEAAQPNGEGQRGFVKRLTVGGPSAPQAVLVEMGTGSYFGSSKYPIPPRQKPIPSPEYVSKRMVANIQTWVEDKNITSNKYPDSLDLAFAISETQVEKGMPSQPFFRPAYFHHEQDVIRNAAKGVRDAFSGVK